jgi:riboflavin biosynthesis pyrimidine reductase
VIFTGDDIPRTRAAPLERAGAKVYRVPKADTGLSLRAVLDRCWDTGIQSVFCEGGGLLASQLMSNGLAGRFYLYVAPFVLGERGVPAFRDLDSEIGWERWHPAGPPQAFGRDVLLTFDRID